MIPVYIGLGSNVGDRFQNLHIASSYLKKVLDTPIFSSVIETKPMYNEDQSFFLNQVLKGFTSLSPLDLLRYTQGIQKMLDRMLEYQKNIPRMIDIDILDYGGWTLKTNILSLPHPLITERPFVLEPLSEIDDTWTLKGKTAKEWLSSLKRI